MEFFHFYTSQGGAWHYTNGRYDVTVDADGDGSSETYEARPIRRKRWMKSFRDTEIAIRMPGNLAPASLFASTMPGAVVWVDVRKTSSPYTILYTGQVMTCEFDKKSRVATLETQALGRLVTAEIPPRAHHPHCSYDLGDRNCGVDLASHADTLTIAPADFSISSDGLEITDSSGDVTARADGFYRNGKVVRGNYSSYIVKHVDNVLTLMAPLNTTATGNITVYPGCLKTLTNCQSRFSNDDRFGGFPHVPFTEPFTEGF